MHLDEFTEENMTISATSLVLGYMEFDPTYIMSEQQISFQVLFHIFKSMNKNVGTFWR